MKSTYFDGDAVSRVAHYSNRAVRYSYARVEMTRSRDEDACPGALQVHQAADGALARIRLPGGGLTHGQLTVLADVADEYCSPAMELTSRGNIQLRAVSDPVAVAEAIASAGLLPSPSHERVRNIIASPLSGRRGGVGDVRPLVGALDAAIQSDDALAGLPGRFWFGLDDGSADVSGLGPDVGGHLVDADTAALVVAGRDTGVRIAIADLVPTLVELAGRFTAIRGTAWRAAELPDPTELLIGRSPSAEAGAGWPPITRPPVGWLVQNDGGVALGAAVPVGVLQSRVARFLAAIEAPLVVTPWRSILVCDLTEGVADTALRVLAPLGLIFDENSPWLDISACTGSPGCAHSAADVRADAAEAAREPTHTHLHFVGCERACGSPPTGDVLVATADGYRRRKT